MSRADRNEHPKEIQKILCDYNISPNYFCNLNYERDFRLSASLPLPDVYGTSGDNPEEKFVEYAMKCEGYVEEIDSALAGSSVQYGSLKTESNAVYSHYEYFLKNQHNKKSKGLVTFLKMNVRPFDGRATVEWMEELAAGKKSLADISPLGIAQKSWKEVVLHDGTVSYPLLDQLANYQPAMTRATWYVKVNVLYSEVEQLSRDYQQKFGDWSFDKKRFEIRAALWTKQLVEYIRTKVSVVVEKEDVDRPVKRTKRSGVSKTEYVALRRKWLYVIKLSQWQFECGLLDKNVYFDGWVHLMQSMMAGGNNVLRMDDCYVVIATIMHHLAQICRSGEHTRRLAVAAMTIIQSFCNTKKLWVPKKVFDTPKHRHIFHSCCDIMRSILLNAPDALVRIEQDFSDWPQFMFTEMATLTERCSKQNNIAKQYIRACENMKSSILQRVQRLREFYFNTYISPSEYSETEVIEVLDGLHDGDKTVEPGCVYSKIFFENEKQQVQLDPFAVKIIIEWAITTGRVAFYRVHTAVALLELHTTRVGNVLQEFLDSFIVGFVPKSVAEMENLLKLMSQLVLRRRFSVPGFMRYLLANGIVGPRNPEMYTNRNFEIETGPGVGVASKKLELLPTFDRCALYLWQLPRGENVSPNAIPFKKTKEFRNRFILNQWLLTLDYTREDILVSGLLEQVQRDTVQVFCYSSLNLDTVSFESLKAKLKILSHHDRCCFSKWLLDVFFGRQKFVLSIFQISTSLEDVILNVLELLAIVDILSMLKLQMWLLSNSKTWLVVKVIIQQLRQYEAAYSATGEIANLLQSFVDRFRQVENGDDSEGTIRKLFVELYMNHKKKSSVDSWLSNVDLPQVLLLEIARSKRNKDDSDVPDGLDTLDATMPLVRTPKLSESPSPDLQQAIASSFEKVNSFNVQTKAALYQLCRKQGPPERTTLMGYFKRPNDQVHILRSVLMESLKDPKSSGYIELLEGSESLSNTIIVWLFREVFPAFSEEKVSNPFSTLPKECFDKNIAGNLDENQQGLQSFILKLLKYQKISLPQFIRLVIVPGFPQQRKQSKGPGLGQQLFTMTFLSVLLTDDATIFMRKELPISIVFPLLLRLCKIAYQMDKNFQLRKRDERGIAAYNAFFELTNDPILCEIVLCDTKFLSEKYILPLYQDSQWYAAVLLSQFYRLPNTCEKDKDGRVQLHTAEEILDEMTTWRVNRGGWLLLHLQLERQQVKQKQQLKKSKMEAKLTVETPVADSPPPPPPSTASPPRSVHSASSPPMPPPPPPVASPKLLGAPPPIEPPIMEDELGISPDFGQAKDATESLAYLIIKRLMRRNARGGTPISPVDLQDSMESIPISSGAANLYASLICNISRRALAAALIELQEILKKDAVARTRRRLQAPPILLLLRGLLCHPSAQNHYAHFLNSLVDQFQWLLETSLSIDSDPSDYSEMNIVVVHEKLQLRLRLVAIISPYIIKTSDESCDRLAFTLLQLLTVRIVQVSGCIDLFSWILDVLQMINASVMMEQHSQLLSKLSLADDLKRRVEIIFPRMKHGAEPILFQNANAPCTKLDPWTTLEQVTDASNMTFIVNVDHRVSKRPRRFYRI